MVVSQFLVITERKMPNLLEALLYSGRSIKQLPPSYASAEAIIEEISVGANAIGAPIFNYENKPVAAAVIVVLVSRVKCDKKSLW